MKHKIKPNRYKKETAGNDDKELRGGRSIDFCIRFLLIVSSISILSLASIYAYDLITQSTLFSVKQVSIIGNQRVETDEISRFAGLDRSNNLFHLNIHALEKKINSHPWIAAASVKRQLPSMLTITVVEHQALAIVKIENIADIIINTQGHPFKEYNPGTDHLEGLPVVTGLDLTRTGGQYLFEGNLFNAVINFLNVTKADTPYLIHADKQMGITIDSRDIYNQTSLEQAPLIPVKMGFSDFESKLIRAKTISEYIGRHFPDRRIIALDLFNLKKVFVKTQLTESGHNVLEKGA